MKLSVKIMAHKKRAALIPDLVQRLGITDDDVIWDRKQDRWDTGRRAWEAVDKTADWGCVIQDDAMVCSDFIAGMEQALDHVPQTCLVSPYVGTRRPAASKVERAVREARNADVSFIEMPSLNWGVAITAPTTVIPSMLPWCDRQAYPNYDRRIGRYVIDVLGWPTWCTWPSLVDHREIPSLVGHGSGRTAHEFIGEDVSALAIDWSKGSVRLGMHPTMAARYDKSAQIARMQEATPKLKKGRSANGQRVARFLRVPRNDPLTPDNRIPRPSN